MQDKSAEVGGDVASHKTAKWETREQQVRLPGADPGAVTLRDGSLLVDRTVRATAAGFGGKMLALHSPGGRSSSGLQAVYKTLEWAGEPLLEEQATSDRW